MIQAQEIEHGLAQREFLLYYQPKFSLAKAEVVGSEALIRWRRADGSITPPGQFIGVAEQSALISKITSHVVEMLISNMPMLRGTNLTPVSFNASARDFQNGKLVRQILEALATHDIAPDMLEVEITENQALACDAAILGNIRKLCDAGLGLAMDDFGLGYSSADTLSRWPFSTIKIDQGLIGRMLTSDKNASIVRSAIRLGHELGVDVVAEGVETEEQYRFLLEAGCKKVQGYLIGKPVALGDAAIRGPGGLCPEPLAVGLVHMAIMDHVHWRKKLVSYALRNAMLPADAAARREDLSYPTLDPRDCLLGRWYRNEGRRFADLPAFTELVSANYALHDIAQRIVKRIQAGATELEIDVLLVELRVSSLALLDHLTTLENIGLGQMYRQRLEGRCGAKA
jgi:EAL domain-containing protein (putative c-di-GMP-specific phosphodiesterase class I)